LCGQVKKICGMRKKERGEDSALQASEERDPELDLHYI
jgi:hypothetical protein